MFSSLLEDFSLCDGLFPVYGNSRYPGLLSILFAVFSSTFLISCKVVFSIIVFLILLLSFFTSCFWYNCLFFVFVFLPKIDVISLILNPPPGFLQGVQRSGFFF